MGFSKGPRKKKVGAQPRHFGSNPIEQDFCSVWCIDLLQNIRGKTKASLYSPRPRPHASVSTPLKWDELKRPVDPNEFTIKTIFKRLQKFGELFEKSLTDRQDISGFLDTLKARRRRRTISK